MLDSHFIGSKLRLARVLQGMTLANLGEKTEVTRQYIQKLESLNGNSPSADMLSALAEILHVSEAFFFSPLKYEVGEESCFFRRRKTTPVHLRSKALACSQVFNMFIEYLQAHVEFPSVNVPTRIPLDNEKIELAAEKCRSVWKLGAGSPVANTIRIAENFGCLVTMFKEISPKIDAFSYFYCSAADFGQNHYVIVRNDNKDSTSRARFDIAHELGHIVLHTENDADDSNIEVEANRFASAFLLPRSAFIVEFGRAPARLDWQHLFQMKVRWGVSVQAIIRRAYDLKLISAVQYRNANIYISRKGWRTSEPCEENIPRETPELIPNTLQSLFGDKLTSYAIISKELNLSPWILQSVY